MGRPRKYPLPEIGEQYFGRVVLDNTQRNKYGDLLITCRCVCGNVHNLQEGRWRLINSPGCRYAKGKNHTSAKHNHTHMDSRGRSQETPEYKAWCCAKQRCYNPNNAKYDTTGGIGITVCERWLGPLGFPNFLEDMGLKPYPQARLTRIDKDGDFEPDNCKWRLTKRKRINENNNR